MNTPHIIDIAYSGTKKVIVGKYDKICHHLVVCEWRDGKWFCGECGQIVESRSNK
jgi:hypothetical protein